MWKTMELYTTLLSMKTNTNLTYSNATLSILKQSTMAWTRSTPNQNTS